MYMLMLVHLQAYVCVYKYNIEMFHISMQRYTRLFALQVASSRRSAFVAASDQPLTPLAVNPNPVKPRAASERFLLCAVFLMPSGS